MKFPDAAQGRKALGIFCLWTLIGLSTAGQFYYSAGASDQPVAWARAWRAALTDWYLLAVLYFAAAYVSRRFPLDRPFRSRHLWIHLGVSAVFSITHLAAYVLARALVFPSDHFDFGESFAWWFVRRFHGNLFYYWTFVIAAHALNSGRRLREREMKAAELETRLAVTQLDALRAQLEPHFLFNTLNTISELVHEDPDAAEQMLTRLSDLLRLSLKTSGEQEVSLQEEIAFVEPYLEIQGVRMGPRLTVLWEIDPAALSARVPSLILQPIIENAIRHGIAPQPSGGTIRIVARRENDRLSISIRDNGAGLTSQIRGRDGLHAVQAGESRPGWNLALAPEGSGGGGVGLSNLKGRLSCLYGADHQFSLRNLEGGGCEVALSIPWRESGSAGRAVFSTAEAQRGN